MAQADQALRDVLCHLDRCEARPRRGETSPQPVAGSVAGDEVSTAIPLDRSVIRPEGRRTGPRAGIWIIIDGQSYRLIQSASNTAAMERPMSAIKHGAFRDDTIAFG